MSLVLNAYTFFFFLSPTKALLIRDKWGETDTQRALHMELYFTVMFRAPQHDFSLVSVTDLVTYSWFSWSQCSKGAWLLLPSFSTVGLKILFKIEKQTNRSHL